MELTGKQKRYLRGLGNRLPISATIGKGGVTRNNVTEVLEALNAFELVKIKFSKNAELSVKQMAVEVAHMSASELVQILGQTALFYKQNSEDPEIKLP